MDRGQRIGRTCLKALILSHFRTLLSARTGFVCPDSRTIPANHEKFHPKHPKPSPLIRSVARFRQNRISKIPSVFRRLAVFQGGWTLEATEAVCSDERLSADLVVQSLFGLIDKSLVLVDVHADLARYHFLETIRGYAEQKLAEAQETSTIATQHMKFFLRRGEANRFGDAWNRRADC